MSIQLTTLENELRVVTDFIPTVETVSLGVWVNIGARHENYEVNGVSHLLEHMAFKGTTKRSASQIAEEIEAVGGCLNAYTARESTAYYACILKQDISLAVDILGDILQNSTFDATEFSREQSVVLQEIGQVNDTPDDVVFDYYQETCYPQQPMGWPILGRADVIQSITPEKVKHYRQRHYGARHMVFAAAGNVKHDHLVEQVHLHFSNFRTEADQSFKSAVYQGGDYRQEKELEQVHIILGFEGVNYQDPDFYVASVLSTLLGEGMSSRLFQEIREKRGLVYTIQSSTSSYQDSGHFTIYAGTGPNEVKDLLPVICEQLRILPTTLTQSEIKRAQAQLKASLMMGLESTSNRCERLANHMLIYGKPIPPTKVVQAIDRVNEEDLARVARKIFQSKPTLTSLGPIQHVMPFEKVLEQLQL